MKYIFDMMLRTSWINLSDSYRIPVVHVSLKPAIEMETHQQNSLWKSQEVDPLSGCCVLSVKRSFECQLTLRNISIMTVTSTVDEEWATCSVSWSLKWKL